MVCPVCLAQTVCEDRFSYEQQVLQKEMKEMEECVPLDISYEVSSEVLAFPLSKNPIKKRKQKVKLSFRCIFRMKER